LLILFSVEKKEDFHMEKKLFNKLGLKKDEKVHGKKPWKM